MKVRRMCWIALMAALMCIASPWTIPVGPIPISLATLCVYLAGALLGLKDGTLAVVLYLLLGAVGLPVFSGFTGGLQKLVGVTGGYLVGYLPCAAAIGFAVDRWGEKKWVVPAAMVVGTALCYALGTAWFMAQSGSGFAAAAASCIVPFLLPDALKIAAASILTYALKKRIK